MAFDLVYDADAEIFVLSVLIAGPYSFGVYRVADEGITFTGITNVREDDVVSQQAVAYVVDAASLFAPFELACHIVPRAIPTPTDIPTSVQDNPPSSGGTGNNGQPQPTVAPPRKPPTPTPDPRCPPGEIWFGEPFNRCCDAVTGCDGG
ncbi:MAG: hypothetical protein JXA10_03535 [Anaerolineae bacterium]|nr:hypothetical protein [Anaerolineae bacterium]